MNQAVIIGRLTRDPELRESGETKVARFTVAADNPFSKEKKADFIPCVAWNKRAEFIAKYFKKGGGIALRGHLRNNDYTKEDGTKVYSLVLEVEDAEFPPSKRSDNTAADGADATGSDAGHEESTHGATSAFSELPPDLGELDGELPF